MFVEAQMQSVAVDALVEPLPCLPPEVHTEGTCLLAIPLGPLEEIRLSRCWVYTELREIGLALKFSLHCFHPAIRLQSSPHVMQNPNAFG